MKHEEMSDVQPTILRISTHVVMSLASRPGYGFLDVSEFVKQVSTRVARDEECRRIMAAGGDSTKLVEYRAKTIYSGVLYDGCCSAAPEEQRRAYEELGKYLYRIAYRELGHLDDHAESAAECTQQALMQIHKHIQDVRRPDAFLGFAIITLKRICWHDKRRKQRKGKVEEPLADGEGLSSLSATTAVDLRDCLEAALSRLPNPKWRTLLILEYFAGRDDTEIARILNTSTNNVHVMRHRALRALAGDQELHDCIQDS